MAIESVSFIVSIGALPAVALAIGRLMAIKTNRDPIMKRYKPGTTGYDAYQRLLKPQRFIATLTILAVMMVVFAAIVVLDIYSFVHTNTPDAHFMLVFGPIAAIAISVFGFIVTYNKYVRVKKKQSDKHSKHSSWLV